MEKIDWGKRVMDALGLTWECSVADSAIQSAALISIAESLAKIAEHLAPVIQVQESDKSPSLGSWEELKERRTM